MQLCNTCNFLIVKFLPMKKQILFICSLFALVLFSSCEKEMFAEIEAIDVQQAPIKKVVFNLPSEGRNSEGSTTMLAFSSVEDFMNTYNNLENAIEVHQDVFYTQYEQLDDDAFEAMELQEGFNDYQPLIDFKLQQNFTNSMFEEIQSQMQVWKQSETSTPENDPESLIDFDPIEQVLFNQNGEVMIAGKIYSFDKPNFD